MSLLLAWRPFLDPVGLASTWWLLLAPLALGISVAYKAVRVPHMRDFVGQTLGMTVQVIAAMILLWIGCFLFIEYLVPFITPQ